MNRNPIAKFTQRLPTPPSRGPGGKSSIARRDGDAFAYGATEGNVAPLRWAGNYVDEEREVHLLTRLRHTGESVPMEGCQASTHRRFGPVAYAQLAQALQCRSESGKIHAGGMVGFFLINSRPALTAAPGPFANKSRDAGEVLGLSMRAWDFSMGDMIRAGVTLGPWTKRMLEVSE